MALTLQDDEVDELICGRSFTLHQLNAGFIDDTKQGLALILLGSTGRLDSETR